MAWNEPGPGHDPWNQGGGGKRGSQPPDLEKLIRQIKSRFGRGRGGGGRPGTPAPIGIMAVVLFVLWLLSGFYTVDAQEQAVVMRFGEIVGDAGPGLGWHLPWPVGSVATVNVTKLRQATMQNTLITQDRNLVDVSLTVQFKVSSARDYLFGVEDPDDTLSQAANSVLRSVVGQYNVDDVLGSAQRPIAEKVKSSLQQVLDDYHCGLHVTDVSLSQVQPPDAVQAAFADAIKAGDDAQRMRDSADAYAKNRLPEARSQADALVSQAKSYRDTVVSKAEGETARFDALLGAYRKSPELTRQRMYIDTMGEILKHARTVVVDGNGGATVNVHVDGAPTETPPPPDSAAPAASGSAAAPDNDAQGASSSGSSADGDSSSRSRDRGGQSR